MPSNLCVARQPILLRHQRQPRMRGDGKLVKPVFDRSIDSFTILIQWPMMYAGPVSSQQMIVEHINEHSGITSPIHRDSRAAPPKGRLRFHKAIYGAMQGNSLCQIVRQYSKQGAFDPVSDDPAHDQGRSVARKQCMGQKVQCCPCREGRSASAALGANEGKLARNRINNAAVRAISLLVVFRSRGLKNIICTEGLGCHTCLISHSPLKKATDDFLFSASCRKSNWMVTVTVRSWHSSVLHVANIASFKRIFIRSACDEAVIQYLSKTAVH